MQEEGIDKSSCRTYTWNVQPERLGGHPNSIESERIMTMLSKTMFCCLCIALLAAGLVYPVHSLGNGKPVGTEGRAAQKPESQTHNPAIQSYIKNQKVNIKNQK